MGKLFLLDGMALAYRGHFAMLRNPRMTSRGTNTSAAFVFANTLLDILQNQEPTHIAVAFDTPEPTHRHRRFAQYKANRDEMPEDLSASLPYLSRLCAGLGVPKLRVPGWEADDVVGTLARLAEAEGFATYMVTPDKDYAQLVSESTFLCKPGRTGSGMEIQGVGEVLDAWKIERIDQVIDILGLMGDSSDNVPGVPGIGPKTAQKLIEEYGTVEALLDRTGERKGKQRENLEKYRDQALLSKELVTIHRDVPLSLSLSDLKVGPPDEGALKGLFLELEFSALGKRLFGDGFEAGARVIEAETEASVAFRTLGDVPHEYVIADGPESRGRLVSQLEGQEEFCFDIETTGLNPKSCDIIGMAFSYRTHEGFYVPFPKEREGALAVLGEFRPVLENPRIAKVGHNLKFDLSVLLWHGCGVLGPIFDTMLAAHLAVPDLRRNMDYLAQALLGYRPRPISDLIGERGKEQTTLRDVPLDQVAEYAAEDADITLQLWNVLRPKVDEEGQATVFHQIECPLVPVLARMEYHGIRLDAGVLRDLSGRLADSIGDTRKRIYGLAGERFNLNSPKQLGEILFDRLGLDPNARRTQKSGQYQTNEQVLTRLAHTHDIARLILQYREATKLKATYVDMLPNAVFRTGRIHTHYEQAVTATGRMQSSGPNLQNIPVRTERGREIRKAFVPRDEGHLLFSADYSQIELRIMAHLSEDARLIAAFENGEDIHATTAMRINGLDDPQDVAPEMRRRAKEVNFGIIYGISAFGLANRLGMPRTQASELIGQYFSEYPGVRKYMDRTIDFARQRGYVQTIAGRRRFLRDINSRNAATRGAAERNAINSPIQGSAADMIKIAMGRIDRTIRERGLRSRMLLQVHDELVFDLRRDEADVLPALIEREMKDAMPLRVPVVVDTGQGENWLDAH